MAKIYKTTNYSQFNFLKDSNREPTPKYMIESIQQKNMLEEHPIICDANMNVIDGQNRLRAAEILNIPIYYMISENVTVEDIAICQVQKPWIAIDFLKYFSNKEDYKFIQDIMQMYSFPIHLCILFCNTENHIYKKFREGKFKISQDKKKLHTRLTNLKEISDTIRQVIRDAGRKEDYITCKVLKCLWGIVSKSDYVHKRMMHSLRSYPCNILPILNFNLCKEITNGVMERVYNYKRRKDDDKSVD